MKCRHCRTEMREITQKSVTYDRCQMCGAHWFDRGELEEIFRLEEIDLNELARLNDHHLPQSCRWCKQSYPPGTRGCKDCRRSLQIRCPRDRTPMRVASLSAVEIDVCPTCTGVWFDGRELEALRLALSPVVLEVEVCDECGLEKEGLLRVGVTLICLECQEAQLEATEKIKAEYYSHWRAKEAADRRHLQIARSMPTRGFGRNPGFFGFFGFFL